MNFIWKRKNGNVNKRTEINDYISQTENNIYIKNDIIDLKILCNRRSIYKENNGVYIYPYEYTHDKIDNIFSKIAEKIQNDNISNCMNIDMEENIEEGCSRNNIFELRILSFIKYNNKLNIYKELKKIQLAIDLMIDKKDDAIAKNIVYKQVQIFDVIDYNEAKNTYGSNIIFSTFYGHDTSLILSTRNSYKTTDDLTQVLNNLRFIAPSINNKKNKIIASINFGPSDDTINSVTIRLSKKYNKSDNIEEKYNYLIDEFIEYFKYVQKI